VGFVMATEIERKFLVADTVFLKTQRGVELRQGYLARTGVATVRVRIAGDEAFLTIKGPVSGISRTEYEYRIPVVDASEMLLAQCSGGRIEKTRYHVRVGSHDWDVDVFHGDNHGLVLAEVELAAEDEKFERPAWLGR